MSLFGFSAWKVGNIMERTEKKKEDPFFSCDSKPPCSRMASRKKGNREMKNRF